MFVPPVNMKTALLLMGHVYMIILVMLCQMLVYREVTALFSLRNATPESGEVEHRNKPDPWSKTLNWYFFAVTNYFLYGESIIYYFKESLNHLHVNSTLLNAISLACRFCRRTTASFRYQPSYYQLYALYDRLYGLCHVA